MRGELAPEQAVVGFCGGPFTVAGYLVEGKPSREFATVKALMYSEPEVWRALMEKLADVLRRVSSRRRLARAPTSCSSSTRGSGRSRPRTTRSSSRRASARILAAADAPTIHFGTGASTLLPAMTRAGGDVIGLDWRIPLDEGWAVVGEERGVQGNLDPAVLLGPWERVEESAPRRARARRRPAGPHLQPRPRRAAAHRPATLSRLAEFVQEATVEPRV